MEEDIEDIIKDIKNLIINNNGVEYNPRTFTGSKESSFETMQSSLKDIESTYNDVMIDCPDAVATSPIRSDGKCIFIPTVFKAETPFTLDQIQAIKLKPRRKVTLIEYITVTTAATTTGEDLTQIMHSNLLNVDVWINYQNGVRLMASTISFGYNDLILFDHHMEGPVDIFRRAVATPKKIKQAILRVNAIIRRVKKEMKDWGIA